MKLLLPNKLLLTSIILCTALLFVPQSAKAEPGDLEVVFSHDPLFTEIGIVPGDTATETITVTNHTEEEKTIGIEFTGTSTYELDEIIFFEVLDNGSIVLGGSADPKTLADLLVLGEISITDILPGDTRLLTINADFPTSVGNPYQVKSSIFDIQVGFVYGESDVTIPQVLGEEIINEEPEPQKKDSVTILGVELPVTGATLYVLFICITITLVGIALLLYRRNSRDDVARRY